jgi:hypothetical protein
MHIYEKSSGSECYASLGGTYELPPGYTSAYLGGSNNFNIKEIEVFAISWK